jgi:amino acid transporter
MLPSSAESVSEHGDVTLLKGGVGWLGSLGMAVGVMAPTGGLAFFFGVTALFVGESGPLVMLVGTLVGIIVALVFAAFARRMSSASSLYMFNGRSLGVSYGFISAWVMLLAYILLAAAICPYENTFTAQIWAPLGDIPPTLTGVITLALAAFLSFRGVRISTYLVAIVEFIGVGTALIVGFAVIAHGGFGGHRLGIHPYFGLNGLSLSGFAFGIAFAFSGLAGFDSAANLGEESRRPRQLIPTTIVLVMVATGVLYIFGSWTQTMAFSNAADLASSASPLVAIADQYLSPWYGHVIAAAAALSLFGAITAELGVASRLLFALGRDGFASSMLARVHRTHRTPFVALGVVTVAAAICFVPLAGIASEDVYAYIGTAAGVMILFAYFLTMAAGAFYFIRTSTATIASRLLPILPIVAIPMTGYALYSTLSPIPAYPINITLYAVFGVVVIGVGLIALQPNLRRRLASSPLFTASGTVSGGDADAELIRPGA